MYMYVSWHVGLLVLWEAIEIMKGVPSVAREDLNLICLTVCYLQIEPRRVCDNVFRPMLLIGSDGVLASGPRGNARDHLSSSRSRVDLECDFSPQNVYRSWRSLGAQVMGQRGVFADINTRFRKTHT